jgi:hypothetical protein
MGGDDGDDGPIFDRAYLRTLLTEVRPDCSLADFAHYAAWPDPAALAALLADAEADGEVAIYPDEFNAAVVCLTPLGATRAGVHLSASHPPIWLLAGDDEPPILAVREAGVILFTDLDTLDESGRVVSWLATRADPKQLEPAAVLADIEEVADRLLLDRKLERGRMIPRRNEFTLLGLHRPWPVDRPHRSGPDTISATTWQERHTRCPFCRRKPPGYACPICRGKAPGRPCPECAGRTLRYLELCLWCQASGIDDLLPDAAVVEAVRKAPEANPKVKRKWFKKKKLRLARIKGKG